MNIKYIMNRDQGFSFIICREHLTVGLMKCVSEDLSDYSSVNVLVASVSVIIIYEQKGLFKSSLYDIDLYFSQNIKIVTVA